MSRYAHHSDEELIAACRAGAEEAWEVLVGRYERLVYTIPRRFGLSPAEADDVFQSVWVALLKHLDTLRQPERLGAWLVTTARRECWERRRGAEFERGENYAPDSMPEDRWVEESSPEEILSRFEQHHRLRQALAHLKERCRRLLQLLYYDPARPSYAEIAGLLKIPVGAIGPTRARCLEELRRLVEGL